MLFKKLLALFLVASLELISCKDDDDTPVDIIISFSASLTGIQEVPANTSTAIGTSTATFNMTTKILTVTTIHSLGTLTSGHIHVGAEGVSGPVVFPFVNLTSPIAFTSTALTATQEADLLANRYYVNLHTAAFPGGEIRGQLFKDGTSASNTINFSATATGAQEVPANASTATGTSTGTFNKTTKIFTVTTTHNVVSPTVGHIHVGAAGVAGPVVFGFTSLASPINFTSPPLTVAQEVDLLNNKHYVNIHTATFPGGEIRGQLIRQ